MLSEFAILEEDEELGESGENDAGGRKPEAGPGSGTPNAGRLSSGSGPSNTSTSSRRLTTVVQPVKRRQSVAARVGSAIVRGMTGSHNPKMGISPAKEREIAAEWEQFEKEKRETTIQRAHRKSQIRAPKIQIRKGSDATPVIESLGPLTGHRGKPQPFPNKNSQLHPNRAARSSAPTKGATTNATDLNILWRVQARKAEGKKTTPEQMAKLRLMLKNNENSGSRRSRNSVYSIDPSLLERPGRIREINSMEEFKERLDQAKEALVCVTFSAKWCGPWRMIKPDVHRLSHIHGDVEFYEIDVDDNEEIAEARRVACMPTFQFFKRGIMLDKFAEPNRIKLDETIRKLRKMEIRPEE